MCLYCCPALCWALERTEEKCEYMWFLSLRGLVPGPDVEHRAGPRPGKQHTLPISAGLYSLQRVLGVLAVPYEVW